MESKVLENPSVSELLAAHNMRRLLDAYRTLAPLTIGGPSTTTLENSPGQLNPGPRNQDPGAFKKFPWMFSPPAGSGRRRHSSCGGGYPPPSLLLSPPPSHQVPGQPGQPGQQIPVLSQRDRESSSLLETTLEGRGISCFSVGGELRLCLTQVLQLVLNTVPLSRIHQACEELQIYCSTSSPGQLTALKLSRVLPISTTQCGLITKSDAERLCSHLLHSSSSSSSSSSSPSPATSSPGASPPRSNDVSLVKVQHNCFGTCIGVIHPKSYSSPDSPSIECTECRELFSPPKFVCHTHEPPGRGIVHWGFSRDNWPTYIQIWDEYSEEEKENAEIQLNNFKNKFNKSGKRKRSDPADEEVWNKKLKDAEQSIPHPYPSNPIYSSGPIPAQSKLVLTGGTGNGFILPWSFVPPNPLYLQSLAQIHRIKFFLDQKHHEQNLPLDQTLHLEQNLGLIQPREELDEETLGLGRNDEFMVGIAAVLAGAGVGERSRLEVLSAVERLVERLQRAEQDKISASERLKGMEDRVTRLEQELASQLVRTEDELATQLVRTENGLDSSKHEDETSSDGGIESGTEADDFSEK